MNHNFSQIAKTKFPSCNAHKNCKSKCVCMGGGVTKCENAFNAKFSEIECQTKSWKEENK